MPKTATYVLQGVDPAAIAAAPFDVKVVETYDDAGRAFTPAEVGQMGGGPGQALLLGYISLGEAEEYRADFADIPAEALGPEDPNWAGNFEVAYWTPEWRAVAEAAIDRLVEAGYDGAYFDVVDEFQLPWAQAHAPGGDAAGAMRSLVQDLSAYAKAQVPTFKIWVNGAEELLTEAAYVDSIDGLFKENLFYNSDGSARQSTGDTRASLDLLGIAQAAGKDVVAIEYVTGTGKVTDVHAKAEAAGLGSYVAKLDLVGVDTEGVLPGQTLHADGLGAVATPLAAPLAATPSPEAAQPQEAAQPPAAAQPATPQADAAPPPAADHGLAGDTGRDTLVFAAGDRGTPGSSEAVRPAADHHALDDAAPSGASPGAACAEAFFIGSEAHRPEPHGSGDPDADGSAASLTAADPIPHPHDLPIP